MALLPEIQKEHDKIVAEILLREEIREKEWFESWAKNNAEKVKEYKRKYRLRCGIKPRLARLLTQQEREERRKRKSEYHYAYVQANLEKIRIYKRLWTRNWRAQGNDYKRYPRKYNPMTKRGLEVGMKEVKESKEELLRKYFS